MKEKNKKIIIIILVTIFILILFFLFYLCFPKIKLNGKSVINLELGQTYKEKGIKIDSIIKNQEKNVKITSNININKVGTYKVKYNLKFLVLNIVKYRIVNVIDKTPPTITLNGDEITVICPNSLYDEEGYKAEDNYDGDITLKVQITKMEDKILYTARDSSNNKTEVTRIIKKEDLEPPVITIKGNSTKYVYKGDTYYEEGATAQDNCDGDLTSNIITEGKVDVYSIGTYEIKYKVKDKSENERIAIRYVKVINRPDYSGSTIYLTFDDGPSSNITPKILDILKEEGIKATFFVINVDDSLNYIIKRAYDEGHTVALHSASHNYQKIYSSEEAYFNDLEIVKNKVKNITGQDVNIIRFPGGTSNTVSRNYNRGIMSRLSKEVVNRGYIYFDWNISSGDAGGAMSKQAVYNNVVAGLSTRKTNVVLMHDSSSKTYTLEALRDIIRYGKENGFRFDRITSSTPPVRHNPQN